MLGRVALAGGVAASLQACGGDVGAEAQRDAGPQADGGPMRGAGGMVDPPAPPLGGSGASYTNWDCVPIPLGGSGGTGGGTLTVTYPGLLSPSFDTSTSA